MISKTIVARDGSREARTALAWAVRRESHRNGTVHVGTEIVRGNPVDVVREFTHPSTLLVVGADDSEGSKWLLRSPGGRLLATARGPTALIPLAETAAGSGIVVGLGDSLPAALVVIGGQTDDALKELLLRAASSIVPTMPCPLVVFGPHALETDVDSPPRAEVLYSA
jgi:nucleotide-binding universal stress UspA family protein